MANRFKRWEQEQHAKRRQGLSPDEIRDVDRQERAEALQQNQIHQYHWILLPEEYDVRGDNTFVTDLVSLLVD
jgi:hypothetical protein